MQRRWGKLAQYWSGGVPDGKPASARFARYRHPRPHRLSRVLSQWDGDPVRILRGVGDVISGRLTSKVCLMVCPALTELSSKTTTTRSCRKRVRPRFFMASSYVNRRAGLGVFAALAFAFRQKLLNHLIGERLLQYHPAHISHGICESFG